MIGLRCAPVMNAQSYLAAPMMKCAAAMSDDDEDDNFLIGMKWKKWHTDVLIHQKFWEEQGHHLLVKCMIKRLTVLQRVPHLMLKSASHSVLRRSVKMKIRTWL